MMTVWALCGAVGVCPALAVAPATEQPAPPAADAASPDAKAPTPTLIVEAEIDGVDELVVSAERANWVRGTAPH
jgi:hypothetical protein